MKKSAFFIRWILFLSISLFCSSGSFAEEPLPADVTALFRSAFPSCTISLSSRCGHTAAAVLRDGQKQILCLAEEQNGTWEMILSNPDALRQDAAVTSLFLDTDETLFWSYNTYGTTSETFRAVCDNGQWRVVSLMNSEQHSNGSISEYHLHYEDGRLQYSTYFCDENENILSHDQYSPVPACWLDEELLLSVFHDAHFPKPERHYTHSWLPETATERAAAELFPGDTFLGGCAKREHLELFLQKPDGDRVIASCRFDEEDGWNIVLSTPLPAGTTYGYENFSSSLVIGDLLVNIGPVDENTCGITYLYPTAGSGSEESMFTLGKNWIASEVPNGYEHCFGDHPWSDIASADWNSLPGSFEEALTIMDTSRWAIVNNPDPSDRLHLRAKPERGARSLGKYYNGAPVRILEQKGDWILGDIFGVQGWMMKKYLAFGSDGHTVEAVFPSRMPVESQKDHWVYAAPEAKNPTANINQAHQSMLVLAVVGDEWYHAWFPDLNLTGYVLQRDWWEGNG